MTIDRGQTLGSAFYVFQSGSTLAQASTQLLRIAIAWWALQKTGSPTAFAAILALSTAAEVYPKPLLSSLGDYFPRLPLAALVQVISSVLTGAVWMLSMSNNFQPALVTAMLMGCAICSAVRDPVSASVLPSLVRPDQVTTAVARRSGMNSSMMLAAPVLASAVVAFAGVSAAVFVAFLTTLISSALFLLCHRKVNLRSGSASLSGFWKSWAARTWGGLIAVRRTHSEFQLALVAAVVNLVMFPFFTVVVPVWVNLHLKGPATYIGIFDAAFGAGLIVGSLGFVNWVSRHAGRFQAVCIGFIWLGGSMLALSVIDSFFASVVVGTTMGVALVLINVNTSAVRAAATPDEFRSRMNAMVVFLSTMMNPVGVWMAGAALAAWGAPAVLALGGAVALAMTPVLMLLRDSRRALSLRDEELVGYYKRAYPDAYHQA